LARSGPLPIQASANGTAFREGLAAAGWVEGQNIAIEWRSAEGDRERVPGLAAELVSLSVDLIATISDQATAVAKQATSTIPIVFCGIGDPVGSGLVQSFARPGGNLTGTTQYVGARSTSKRLGLLKELVPGLARVGYLQNLTGQGSKQAVFSVPDATIADVQSGADQLGMQVNFLDVPTAADLEPAFEAATSWRADALLVGGSSLLHELDAEVMRLAARERLPAIYLFTEQVRAGGLLSYGPNLHDLFRRAAVDFVDKILRGANPADLPVEQPTAIDLAFNRTTAQALGLTNTPPAFAAQVTEWIA
jgi:putative ABC transport system substrate-binding protein